MKKITFTGKVRKPENASAIITIPKNEIDCLGSKNGDFVKVTIEKTK